MFGGYEPRDGCGPVQDRSINVTFTGLKNDSSRVNFSRNTNF